jgi:hypothetical protein
LAFVPILNAERRFLDTNVERVDDSVERNGRDAPRYGFARRRTSAWYLPIAVITGSMRTSDHMEEVG